MTGRIVAVSLSEQRGTRKHNVPTAELRANHGLVGDAHAGPGKRQVSLLGIESIRKMQAQGADVHPGDFAENLTTEGIEVFSLPIGTRLRLGKSAVGEVTQIGKTCHHGCEIFKLVGDCVMPREGIFIRVIEGGEIRPGDVIEVLPFLRVAILTVSDSAATGQAKDLSGTLLRELVESVGGEVVCADLLPDNYDSIAGWLRRVADDEQVNLALTSGGTGLAPTDVTPEATLSILDKQAPGIAEALRIAGLEKTPRAMLSRGVAGVRKQTLIVNLSGSPKAVREQWEALAPVLMHAVETVRGRGTHPETDSVRRTSR
ncbi:MAG: molybdenum cofactor synthesis domain-containing protein [Candidatus Zipacnadales bacterium]